MWWDALCHATKKLLFASNIQSDQIKSIGLSYQMHGLVVVNENQKVLRPAIIWCDSRATEIGMRAFNDLGKEYCAGHLLNSPGNFTASKLKWIKDKSHLFMIKLIK